MYRKGEKEREGEGREGERRGWKMKGGKEMGMEVKRG